MLDVDRWLDLVARLGVPAKEVDYFSRLEKAYAEPHRRYHNGGHIEQCLQEFDNSQHLAEHAAEVEFALWLHDEVYLPEALDNEEQSAELAVDILRSFGCSESLVNRVSGLILARKEHCLTRGADHRLILDIDLSILGQPPLVFNEYGKQIRAEYSWVTLSAYRTERYKVLRSFLGREQIYQTEYFFDQYEKQARHNLIRALNAL